MISASSSLASGLLSGYFGTSASNTTSGNSTTNPVAGAESSDAYILDGSLSPAASSLASFLSNAAFAQDTENLLLDPRANGELTGTPSANVQKIISEIGASVGATIPSTTTPTSSDTTSTPSSTGTTPTSAPTTSTATLPPEGIIA